MHIPLLFQTLFTLLYPSLGMVMDVYLVIVSTKSEDEAFTSIFGMML